MSIRTRRRERREFDLVSAADGISPEYREQTEVASQIAPLEEKKETPPMNAPRQAPLVLQERDDDAIDKLLDDARYGPDYIVSVSIARKGGNLSPNLRQGIVCPLVRVKTVAQALCELVTGGGQLKVTVEHAIDNTGNKKRLMTPWFEPFSDPPRVGEPWNSLTIEWDASGGDNGDGAWKTCPRAGTNARNEGGQATQFGQASNGFGVPIAGPRVAQAPDFPQPVRGLGGMVMPPPPNMIPASLRMYPADQQWQMLAAQHERTYGVRPSLEPVDIMGQWKNEKGAEVGDLRAEKRIAEERLEHTRHQGRSELEQLNKRLADAERKLADTEARHQRDLDKAEAKARDDKRDAEMQAMKERISSGGGRAASAEKSGLAAIDPTVMVATINGAFAMMNASAERQATMMMAMMKPPAPPPPGKSTLEEITPLLVSVGAIAGPLAVQWLANKDPEKIDALETERAMRQQQLAQMLMDQVHRMAPQDEPMPIWYQPVMTVIQGMMGAVQTAAVSAGAQRLPALPSQPAQPTIHVQAAPQQEQRPRTVEAVVEQEPSPEDQRAIEVPATNLEQQIDEFAKIDPNAANVTRLVMRTVSARGLDPRLLTPEWTSIVFAVHHRPTGLDEEQEQTRVANLVTGIVDHLEHCRTYQLLPEPVAHVFEKPESLGEFLTLMPIHMMDREYAEMLLAEIVEEISTRERERKKSAAEENVELDESDEEEDEETDDDESDEKVA